jgi:hypothetical protein
MARLADAPASLGPAEQTSAEMPGSSGRPPPTRSVAYTLDRYSHVVPAMQEDAAETVASLLGLSE